MKSPEIFNYRHVGGRFPGLIALAFVSWIAVLIGALANPEQFAFSYLFAWTFFFTLGVGSLFWTIVHHATRAEWSVVVRRQMENLGGLLLVLAVLFVPFVFVGDRLWGETTWFFWAKASAYFFVFAASASLLRALSIAQDSDGSAARLEMCRRIAFLSAAPFALCLTFASFDWLMSLKHGWYSTIWGVYLFAGSALSAMCLIVLITAALQRVGHLRGVVTPEHYHIMGKLMFALTMFWAYIAFSQYLLIWYANLPEDTTWFSMRGNGGWQVLGIVLVIGQFLVPFLLLLPVTVKRSAKFLGIIALWILLMHLLDIYFIILPSLHESVHVSIQDATCLLAIGSTLAAVFLKWLGDSALYPPRDPRLPQSLALKN